MIDGQVSDDFSVEDDFVMAMAEVMKMKRDDHYEGGNEESKDVEDDNTNKVVGELSLEL